MANSSRGAAKTVGTGSARARKPAATAEKSKGKAARARKKESARRAAPRPRSLDRRTHSGHLTLMNCERSRLADFAGETL